MPVIKAKEEEKDALKAKCIEEVVPKVFGALIKQLEKNGGSHFAGSEVHNYLYDSRDKRTHRNCSNSLL